MPVERGKNGIPARSRPETCLKLWAPSPRKLVQTRYHDDKH